MGQWTDKINNCAETQFGIKALLPVQLLVVHNIMEAMYPEEDRDCYNNQLVILPTGTGKSLCFQIPAYLSKTPTIIIYPLLSLINDQLRRMNEAGLKSYRMVGGMSYKEHAEVTKALQNKACSCILTNPETLENDKVVELLASFNPSLVVIDEAHCISKWGKSFRTSYLQVGKRIQTLKAKVTVAFTATASDTVIHDIKQLLFLGEDSYLLRGHANRENITYSMLYCVNRDEALVSLLRNKAHNNADRLSKEEDNNNNNEHDADSNEEGDGDESHTQVRNPISLGMHPVHTDFNSVDLPAIVFCNTRSLCYRVSLMLRDRLRHNNIYFYHAGLSKQEKTCIESWFLHSENGILIATCAYGMGVDKSNIRTVIHYEHHTDIENFLQETGRAGRDKQAAVSITLAEIDHVWKNGIKEKSNNIPSCRREHFMEALSMNCESCSGCDVCIGAYPILQNQWYKIIQTVRKFVWCFDEAQLVQIVLAQHQTSSIYSRYMDKQNVEQAVAILLAKGVLQKGKLLWKGKIGLNKRLNNRLDNKK